MSIVAAVCLLLMVIGWPVSAQRMQELASELHKMPTVLIIVIAALVLWGIGIIVLYGMIKERLHRRTAALLEKNEIGEAAVSFSALELIVQRAVKAGSDVVSCNTKVYAIGSNVKIDVRAVIAPTVSLVELTRALQELIRNAIKEACGVSVGEVDVTVDQAEIPPKKE